MTKSSKNKKDAPPIKIYVYDKFDIDINYENIDLTISYLEDVKEEILKNAGVDPDSLLIRIEGHHEGCNTCGCTCGCSNRSDIETYVEFRRLETDKEYKKRMKTIEILKSKPKKKAK